MLPVESFVHDSRHTLAYAEYGYPEERNLLLQAPKTELISAHTQTN
jgi:hypothetical protein